MAAAGASKKLGATYRMPHCQGRLKHRKDIHPKMTARYTDDDTASGRGQGKVCQEMAPSGLWNQRLASLGLRASMPQCIGSEQ